MSVQSFPCLQKCGLTLELLQKEHSDKYQRLHKGLSEEPLKSSRTESHGQGILGELVDLRFVHVAESRTTVRDIPGKLFTAYMLDISQYTGERRRRELEMITFWKREELDKIRRSRYVLDVEKLVRNDQLADVPEP